MPLMTKIVVADTGPLIALALVDLLPALPELFTQIYIPQGVLIEASHDGTKPGAQAIVAAVQKGWLTAPSVTLPAELEVLLDYLDRGEAETLALAKQLDAVALVDERRGRRVAARHGIAVTGSAAVLIKAKQAGLVQAINPLLTQLRQCGYRMSDALTTEVLKRVGEAP